MSPEAHYWLAVWLALSTGFVCGLYGANPTLSVRTRLLFLILFSPAFVAMFVFAYLMDALEALVSDTHD